MTDTQTLIGAGSESPPRACSVPGFDAAIALGVKLGLLEVNGNIIGLTVAGKQKAEETYGPAPQNTILSSPPTP